MKNHAIVQLKAIAKERGIKGYYKLRKADLIHALEATRLVGQKVIYLMSRFQITPLLFYNQHLGENQISLQKTCKRQKISLRVCKILKILVSGC